MRPKHGYFAPLKGAYIREELLLKFKMRDSAKSLIGKILFSGFSV
jgi:hypothetical protein